MGGGYQDVCTKIADALPASPAAGADQRLDELRRMGLSRPWRVVAAAIGFDAFMAAWHALATVDGLDSRDRIVVPKLASYYRYQRNQLIGTLAATGHSVDEIRLAIRHVTGESLSMSHIRRQIEKA